MIYNTIMVQFDVHGSPEPRLAFATQLARRFDANLIGFCAADVHPAALSADGVVIDGTLLEQMTEDLQTGFDRLKAAFEEATTHDDQAMWRSVFDRPTECLAINARAADLIVTARPGKDIAADPYRTVNLGKLILAAGRPVLVMADKGDPLEAKRVLVAWKDTREACRAVADAMPFLSHADDVLVVTLQDHDRAGAETSVTDVVRYLMRHDVKARSKIAGHQHQDDAETLVTMAQTMGADLIVAGAYGHSRLREWAFGGVTRSLLRDRRMNMLFSN